MSLPNFKFQRAYAIARKEVFHILRDPFTLGSALGLPIFMVVMFGVAIEFNVRNIALSVVDADHSYSSRQLVETFGSSRYFLPHTSLTSEEAIQDIISQRSRVALLIPPQFEKDVVSEHGTQVQLLVDGADGSTVAPILGYLSRIQVMASVKLKGPMPAPPYTMESRFLFNPELNSKWFVIPGLNVIVMGILSVLLTALTIAREYENGSMELLLSTPVEPLEIMVGKLAPYGLLGIISTTMIYFIARTVFGLPFVGNLAVFFGGFLLFLLCYLAQGLLISVGTKRQAVAMQMAMMTAMLPSQLLSGFIFPVESMPKGMQYFTMLLPARWFMQIARDTYLKGSTFFELAVPFIALSLFLVVMLTLGTRSFKRTLQ